MPFNGYTDISGSFPYSSVTESIVKNFPRWTKIRQDKTSIGAQFLNVFGLQLEEVQNFLNEALWNQYLGSANIGEIDYIYKVQIASLDQDLSRTITADGTAITECETLFEFYSSSGDVAIIDFDLNVIFLKQEYSEVIINGVSYSGLRAHHVWNLFDEFALLLGLRRRFLETNQELKERIVNVFQFRSSANKNGIAKALGRELGLYQKLTWGNDTPVFEIDETLLGISILPKTFTIDRKPAEYSQIDYDSLNNKYSIHAATRLFYREDFNYVTNNVQITFDKKIVLMKGAKSGYVITPPIGPSHLNTWKSLILDATGTVTVDVVDVDYDNYQDKTQAFLVRGLTDSDLIEVDGEAIAGPVRFIINLSRVLKTDPSPIVNKVDASFNNLSVEVGFIHDIVLNSFYDESFNASLYENEVEPSAKLRTYVKTLSEIVPIMWGKWKWDESFWDIVEEDMMGLHVIPNVFDPRLASISNTYFQSGIGYGLDLNVSFDESWSPQIHNGFYYSTVTESVDVVGDLYTFQTLPGSFDDYATSAWSDFAGSIGDQTSIVEIVESDPQFMAVFNASTKEEYSVVGVNKNSLILEKKLPVGTVLNVYYGQEHYLYSNKIEEVFGEVTPVSELVLSAIPGQEAPIIVTVNSVAFTPVFFLDEAGEPSIINKEYIVGTGEETEYYLSYNNLFDVYVDGVLLDSGKITGNKISCLVNEGEEVEVLYKVQDSFMVIFEENQARIFLSAEYTGVHVEYEGSSDSVFYLPSSISVDPISQYVSEGFLYLTNTVEALSSLRANVSPDTILGNGYDSCLVVVDAFDSYGNFVLNKDYSALVVLRKDSDQSIVVDSGSLELVTTSAGRSIFRYSAPDAQAINATPSTATITFVSSGVNTSVEVKLK